MLREKRGEMVLKMLHLCVLMAANLNKDSLRDGNHNILGIDHVTRAKAGESLMEVGVAGPTAARTWTDIHQRVGCGL